MSILDTKRQGRMTKEAPQQLGMASHTATLAADRRLDVFRGVGGEVRQAAVLQVAPEELHRFEVRRVRRKPDDVAPRMSGEPGPHELVLVGAPTIPEQDEWSTDLTGEMAKEPQHLGPRMLRCGCSANATVSCRRRGDTISAPMPETFSCERARTGTVGVAPHGAHVRRRTGIIRKPVSSRQTRCASSRWSFFYRGPLPLDPLPHATVVALLRARLWALRTEPTGAEQAPDVVGVIDDREMVTDQVDDSPTRPQARPIAGRF